MFFAVEWFFLNKGVREMLEENEYRAVYIIFSIKGAYINRVTEFQNDTNTNGVHYIYFDIVSNVVS